MISKPSEDSLGEAETKCRAEADAGDAALDPRQEETESQEVQSEKVIYWAQLAALVPVGVFLYFGNAALCWFVTAGLGVLAVSSRVLGISTMGMGTFYDRRTDPEGYRSATRLEVIALIAALAVALFKAKIAGL